ncbi:MAG: hypothetical protein NXY57DRAFT_1044681 [Lentinula lateritia]|nr:MAG: hypothetical protein NXY57DRAFT_1044681 [Lentinula lateritia]
MKRTTRMRTRKPTRASKKKRKAEDFATYEVGFIRTATRTTSEDGVVWKYLIHWKGWLEETNEPAYALRYAGDALTLFWTNVENPHDIYYDEAVGTVVLPNQTYINENCKLHPVLSWSARVIRNTVDICEDNIQSPPTYSQENRTTSSSNPGPTGFDGPSQETILIDPKTLWLPPDRLGFNCKDWQLLYQIVCLSIDTAVVGISGKDFFQTIKKARKQHKSDDWVYSESCVVIFFKTVFAKFNDLFWLGPCCRQDPVFFVAIEWAFISDPDAQLRQRAAGKRRREAAQRARKREDKMIDEQRAEIELEDGEIQE